MPNIVYVLLSFLLIIPCFGGTQYELKFRHHQTISCDSIWIFDVRSKLQCITQCELSSDCESIGFNKITHVCIGYKTCNGTTSFSSAQTDWMRYCKDKFPVDCEAYYQDGYTTSGVYTIYPSSPLISPSFDVYCDMDSFDGGLTVFQHRSDGSVDFYRTWNDYQNGFGSLNGEFWLGNDKISLISNSGMYKLYILMTTSSDSSKYAIYDNFVLNDGSTDYTLSIEAFLEGTVADAFWKESKWYVDGMKFSTKDRDNDMRSHASCAVSFTGAWWFNDCMTSNLNGQYYATCTSLPGSNTKCNYWYGEGSMKMTKMMLKRKKCSD